MRFPACRSNLRAFARALPCHSGLWSSVATSGRASLNSLPPPLTSHLPSWPPSRAFSFSTALIFALYIIYFFVSRCSSTERKPRESASASVASLKLSTVLGTQGGLSKCVLSECMSAFAFYENPWGKGTVNAVMREKEPESDDWRQLLKVTSWDVTEP